MKYLSLLFFTLWANSSFSNDSYHFLEAVVSGNFEHVANISDISQPLENPLLLALAKGNHDMALLLLEKGASANFEEESGDTPLIVATRNHLLSNRLVEAMLKRGAVIDHIHRKTGMTAIMYAASVGYVRGLKILSDFGGSFDRINLKSNKNLLDHAADKKTRDFLMKSHRYFGKSLQREGYRFIRDELGMPHVLGQGADGIAYLAVGKNETKVAKFCYNRGLLKKGIVEYERCKDNEEWSAKEWSEWFDNKMNVEEFSFFSIKDLVKGQSLFNWMTSIDPNHDFGSDTAQATQARQRLRELLIKMLKKERGFVGDFNTSNIIFSENHNEWVVIDGHKTVACYSPSDHEWIWLEYCQASVPVTKKSLLEAFKLYAIGPSPTGNPRDDEAFGVWLKPRMKNGKLSGPSQSSKEKMIQLINGIELNDLE